MSTWPQVTYVYDGSFAGFLTCLWDSFTQRVYPFYFFTFGQEQYSLYPVRELDTHSGHAKKIYARLKEKLSPQSRQLMEEAFLTCLPQKERHIYDYIYANIFAGTLLDPTDDRMLILLKAVRHLMGEVELLLGFSRFSDYSGVLVGEISPKNRVLPLMKDHFCARLPNETFLLYDRTHKEALCHENHQGQIVPLEDLTLNAPERAEVAYRQLWKTFYDTIAILQRNNPDLRRANMPKRYWQHMPEVQ